MPPDLKRSNKKTYNKDLNHTRKSKDSSIFNSKKNEKYQNQ